VELPPDILAALNKSPPINVLRMFAGTQEMFPALTAMVRALFYDKDILPKLREVIVLRCAHLLDCGYEWQANVVMGRNAGLPDALIAALRQNGPVESADPAIRLICTATDELTRTATLSDATLAELIAAHGPRVASKYIVAIGWFNLLSRFLNATRVPLEARTNSTDGQPRCRASAHQLARATSPAGVLSLAGANALTRRVEAETARSPTALRRGQTAPTVTRESHCQGLMIWNCSNTISMAGDRAPPSMTVTPSPMISRSR